MPYAPAAAWAAVLLFLGSRSGLPAPDWNLPLDKLVHFLAYAALGTLAARGWLNAGRRDAVVLVLAAGLLVGAADELHQSSVSGRYADPADWVADALGVVAGFGGTARLAREREDA